MIGSIERLRREQDALYYLLHGLERQLVALQRDRKPNYPLMRDILHYLTEYADRYHHPYEDLLYRRLAERNPAMEAAVAGIYDEHRQLAERGRVCHRQVQDLLAGNLVVRAELYKPGLAYLCEYRAHMQREEDEILKAAIGCLKPTDWLRIDTVFLWSNGPLFGSEVGAQYQALRNRIQAEAATDSVDLSSECSSAS